MRRPALLAVAAFAAVILVVAVHWWIPWLTARHMVIASTPAPRPLFTSTIVNATPSAPVCLSNVPMDGGDQVAAFVADNSLRSSPAVTVTATGPGYRAQGTAPGGSYAARDPIRAPLTPPSTPLVATICASPQTGTLPLFATTEDRTRSRPAVTQGGRPVNASVTLTFYRRNEATIASELGRITRGAHVVAAPAVPSWLIAVIAVLAFIGIVPAVAWALAVSLRDEAELPSS